MSEVHGSPNGWEFEYAAALALYLDNITVISKIGVEKADSDICMV